MRHVQLIAISGSIGATLFVSIGSPLTHSGPLGLLLGMAFWCSVVWAAANCLIEMTTLLPVDGGFVQLSSRFVDQSFGCALGWNYYITQLSLVNFELTAIHVIVQYWDADLSPAITISWVLVLVAALNLWKVSWFGEVEFWISITKVILIFALTLYTFITMVGGNPKHDVYGFRFWKNPGVFGGRTAARKVVQAIFDSASWAVFAVVGPDYLSLISGEVKNPRRIMPKAFNSTIYRIIGFYIVGSLCVGVVVSSNDESLLGAIASGAKGAAKSPYIISMNRLGIPVLPHIVNAFVLVSCISTGNGFIYTSSRTLVGLSQRGQAPKIFNKTNRNGVPYVAVIVSLLIGCLSYMSVSKGAAKVLNWWINLVSSTSLVTWAAIAITSMRFRKGLSAQGLMHILPVRGHWMPYSSYWLLFWSVLVAIFLGYYVFIPGQFTAQDFIFNYGSLFIYFAILIGTKTYDWFVKKNHVWVIPAKEIDLTTGLDEIETYTEACEAHRLAQKHSAGNKVSNFFFRE
ncbi:hypothetical protein VHUM_00009 [Vanrija humicola]|uniref:Amino acid permease/ SLC12A domain-containing protein n=1 Tax=Vanrija humicola TaxID=5417 RepID=A0A7D8ZAE7_VANHU|nr:hypothetical protein VHUM_00009 [Vanrija humicola]